MTRPRWYKALRHKLGFCPKVRYGFTYCRGQEDYQECGVWTGWHRPTELYRDMAEFYRTQRVDKPSTKA